MAVAGSLVVKEIVAEVVVILDAERAEMTGGVVSASVALAVLKVKSWETAKLPAESLDLTRQW